MEKDFIDMNFVMYVEVSKEEYDSFFENHVVKNRKHKSIIKGHQNGWSELYDFKVSKDTPIVKISPFGKYYILRKVLDK